MTSPFLQQLSVRTRNCLWRMKLTTRAAVLRAVKNRTLHPGNTDALGFGAKSLAEVRAALGLKPDLTPNQIHGYRARFAHFLRQEQDLNFREIARVLHLRGPGQAMDLAAHGAKLSMFWPPRKIVSRLRPGKAFPVKTEITWTDTNIPWLGHPLTEQKSWEKL